MWVAKSHLLNRVIGKKKFSSARACLEYIDVELIILNYLMDRLVYQLYMNDTSDVNISLFKEMCDVRPWSVSDKRWADSFDY